MAREGSRASMIQHTRGSTARQTRVTIERHACRLPAYWYSSTTPISSGGSNVYVFTMAYKNPDRFRPVNGVEERRW